ncbi:hypothetical protein [Streptomyces sp. JNUCC 63]
MSRSTSPSRSVSAARLPDPDHPFRVEAVGGLARHEDGQVPEECGDDAQALAHAGGKGSDAAVCDGGETGVLEGLVHAAGRDAVADGEEAQVAEDAAVHLPGPPDNKSCTRTRREVSALGRVSR